MQEINIMVAGTIKELNEFLTSVRIPAFCHIPWIILFQEIDSDEEETLAEPWRYSSEVIVADSNKIGKISSYNPFCILDLGNRMEKYPGLQDLCLQIPPEKHGLFGRFMELMQEMDYCRRMLDIITVNATEGIQIADEEGNYIYCNDASYRITGLTPEEREGRNVFDVQRDGSIATVLKTKHAVYAHVNLPKPGGKRILSNAAPIYNEKREIIGAVTVFNDSQNADRLENAVEQNQQRMEALNRQYGAHQEAAYNFEDLVGVSDGFQSVLSQARRAAYLREPVLITGESGTGKETLANGIHRAGDRSSQPFIRIDVPAVPAYMLEGELFGYGRNALGNESKGKPGKIELADQGSLFLMNIGGIDISMQSKLLQFLQEHEVRRLNGNRVRTVDTRLIVSSSVDLAELVQKGAFRKDLFYRLDAIHIEIPPLRERKEDIGVLFDTLVKKIAQGREIETEADVYEALAGYDWPGNIRELENTVIRLVIYQGKQHITGQDIRQVLRRAEAQMDLLSPEKTLEQMEKIAIRDSLRRHGADLAGKKEAARALGISLSSLYDRIKKYGI